MTFDNSKGTRLARLCSSSICIVITVSFMLHAAYRRAYRDFAKRVTIALVLGNLLHAAVDLLGLAFHSKSLCVVYGMVRSWALLSTATWSVVLAFHIYSLLRYNRSIRTREKWLHLLCWLPPVVAALVPLSDSASYGEAGLWCVPSPQHARPGARAGRVARVFPGARFRHVGFSPAWGGLGALGVRGRALTPRSRSVCGRCWITGETRTTTAFEFVCFYVPMWSMLTVICVLYGRCVPRAGGREVGAPRSNRHAPQHHAHSVRGAQ